MMSMYVQIRDGSGECVVIVGPDDAAETAGNAGDRLSDLLNELALSDELAAPTETVFTIVVFH